MRLILTATIILSCFVTNVHADDATTKLQKKLSKAEQKIASLVTEISNIKASIDASQKANAETKAKQISDQSDVLKIIAALTSSVATQISNATSGLTTQINSLSGSVSTLSNKYSFNPGSCKFIPGDCIGAQAGATYVQAKCGTGEFLLTHGSFNGSSALIADTYLLQAEAPFDTKVPNGVEYTFKSTVAQPTAQLCVDIVCCKLPA